MEIGGFVRYRTDHQGDSHIMRPPEKWLPSAKSFKEFSTSDGTMTFSDDFWQSVRQTSDILKACVPLCDSEQAERLRRAYESAPPETRAHLKHELKMLIARLIQVDRLLGEG